MNEISDEFTLANERVHWGIFIPAIFALFFLSLAVFPLWLILKSFGAIMIQLNQQPIHMVWNVLLELFPDLVIGGSLLLMTWIAYRKSEIRLTNKRLIFRTGLLSRFSCELPLENVESIFIIEPIIGRLFCYGTVAVTSVGGIVFPLRYIRSPQKFHDTLQTAVVIAKKQIRKGVNP
jgi:hypothetical protein